MLDEGESSTVKLSGTNDPGGLSPAERLYRQGCEIGARVRAALQGSKDVSRLHYASLVEAAVLLRHSYASDKERDEFRREHGAPARSDAASGYLPELQILFSADKRDREHYKGKLSTWAKLARGVVEGCEVAPEPGAIKNFLLEPCGEGKKTGRALAAARAKELPGIREEEAAKAAEKDGKAVQKALERLALGEDWSPADCDGDPMAFTLLALKVLSMLLEQGLLRISLDDFETRLVAKVEPDRDGFVLVPKREANEDRDEADPPEPTEEGIAELEVLAREVRP